MPKDDSVKQTCCGCMYIRTGVEVLQILEILTGIASLVFGIMAATGEFFPEIYKTIVGRTQNEVYILIAVRSVELLISMIGLYSVVKRRIGGYIFYAYASVLILLVQAGSLIVSFNLGGLLGIPFGIYWCYVYLSYIQTLKAEIEVRSAARAVVAA
ncbi:hypothetical protein BC828DRAFT_380472 [Blastocladiella britannica]|nr:hypothetical protein BC828DRAFT_380472 [Blastocladiella britannica]